ncbi:MAG: DUF6062 family protein [Clostridia bacterium]|nr:DUF6062 family protein [Clostridia bacterium]
MKYHIDTIPVWDAVKLQGECFVCAIRRRLELEETERYLGASVMEPDTRIRVNKQGFCAKHQVMLYAGGNRLGHALMMDTHLQETQKQMKKPLEEIRKAAEHLDALTVGDKLTGKGLKAKQELQSAADKLAAMTTACVLCQSIDDNLNRYLHTFFHLYKNDGEFRKALENSKGVCMPDAALLVSKCADELPAKEAAAFARLIVQLTEDNLQRVEDDLSWFIKKYDYRYDSEPWKNSKDAVERTVNKMRGWCVGQEPNPKEK